MTDTFKRLTEEAAMKLADREWRLRNEEDAEAVGVINGLPCISELLRYCPPSMRYFQCFPIIAAGTREGVARREAADLQQRGAFELRHQ